MTKAVMLSPIVAKPAHVHDELVYDFDMNADPGYLSNPHERLLDLLNNAPPVFWTPRNRGHWVFLSYAANFNAARDTDTFSSEQVPMVLIEQLMAKRPPGTPRIPIVKPVSIDPPEHGKYRLPLQRVFSPKSISKLAGDIRVLADQLIDNIIERGECEFMAEVAEPLPVQIFLKMMGLPPERQHEYRAMVRELLSFPVGEMEATISILHRIVASMRETILERRDHPRDDIISKLWQAEIDGQPTTLDQLDDFCVLLFVAGLDTVMNAMGHGVSHLAQDQSLQKQLRENPHLIPEATEELLRRYSFVMPPRRVTKDTVFDGVTLRKNERVMLFLPTADLDQTEFPDPATFDLMRENKAHIQFNVGPHRCLGSHLARLELRILYEQLLQRMPEFRLNPLRPPTFHCGSIIGVDSLNLIWA